MIDSLGDVLPFAAGVALSPIPIIGVIWCSVPTVHG